MSLPSHSLPTQHPSTKGTSSAGGFITAGLYFSLYSPAICSLMLIQGTLLLDTVLVIAMILKVAILLLILSIKLPLSAVHIALQSL